MREGVEHAGDGPPRSRASHGGSARRAPCSSCRADRSGRCSPTSFASFASIALLLSTTGCPSTVPRTEVLLHVVAEPGVAMRATELHIVVLGGPNRTMDALAVRTDRTFPESGSLEFPFDVGLVPADGDPGRVFQVSVTARDATHADFVTERVLSGYRSHVTSELTLHLEDSCIGLPPCAPGSTCHQAMCVDAYVDPSMDVDAAVLPVDAGTDAGHDAFVSVDVGVDAPPPSCDATVCGTPMLVCADASTLHVPAGAMPCCLGATDVPCAAGCSGGACTGGVALRRGLGGAADLGADALPPGDDGSSAAIPLTGVFGTGVSFYGGTYTTLFVNNNGNVSFGGPLDTYTPTAFPGAPRPMIAPWWGDVDTSGAGEPAKNNVAWAVGAHSLTVTWDHVGYFAMHDTLQNSFQLVLTDRGDVTPGDFDVEIRYAQCAWTTGDMSGGVMGLGGMPAAAGFDGGNGVDALTLPGSGTASVLDLATTSNVGVPGLWRYRVRGGLAM